MKRKAMSLPESPTLSMEGIKQVAEGFKQDLQGEANRHVRRNDAAGALAVLKCIEYVDQLVYHLELRAGSRIDTLKRPARARDIHIPENLTRKRGKP